MAAIDLVAPAQIGAVVVNVALFTVGCVVVFLVLRAPLGDSVATAAVVLLIVAPGAQFTIRPGPESLFLLASALSLYAAQQRRWWWVAIAATVAALSRPQGILLLLPLLVVAQQQWASTGFPRAARDRAALGTALLAPVLGLAAFCAYLEHLTGNFFATFEIHKAWDNSGALPGVAVMSSLRHLLVDRDFVDYYGWNLIPASLLVLIVALGLLVHGVVRRTLPPALLGYLAVNLVLLLTRSETQATLRYLLVVFPVVGLAAVLLAPRRALFAGTVIGLWLLQAVTYLAALQGALWTLT